MAKRKKLRYDSWVTFGWHGVSLRVPEEWNPGKITGDRDSGDVRLDDAELVRVELEWKDARGDARVGQIVDRYVEGLAKAAQKEKRPLEVSRPFQVDGLDLEGLDPYETFSWQSVLRVHTLAAYVPVSDRLVFVRVMSRPHEDVTGLLADIYNSLEVSPADGPLRWSLYGLQVTSPEGYDLENYELKSGHIRLAFQSGKESLQVDRLSLAAVLLRNRSLDSWYREFFRKDLRHVDFETAEDASPSGQVLTITGRPKGRIQGMLQPLPFWNARPRRSLSGRAWVDSDENKILVVQAHYRDEAPDIQAVCDSVGPEAAPPYTGSPSPAT